MAVAVIPYDGKDPLKYLYRTIHNIRQGIDVIVVDTTFNIYPPGVKRIKQRSPGIGGARHDGFRYALEQGYDCIINADSHIMIFGDLNDLCKTKTFASTYHHPWIETPTSITFPIKIYASVVYAEEGKIYWCTLLEKPQYLPMTSEPLYAVKANVLELILDKYLQFTSYGLDNVALYWAPEGEIIDTVYYYHLGVLDRGKSLKRKPRDEEAEKFVTLYPRIKSKVDPILNTQVKRACFQLWP